MWLSPESPTALTAAESAFPFSVPLRAVAELSCADGRVNSVVGAPYAGEVAIDLKRLA
jgi:hypothetical protein